MFPKVPQSSLGILRVPQLTPCPWTPHLKNPRKNVFPLKGTGFTAPLEPCTFTDLTLETNTANTNTQNANRSGVFWVEGETKQTCKLRAQTNDEEKKQVWVRGLELCFFVQFKNLCLLFSLLDDEVNILAMAYDFKRHFNSVWTNTMLFFMDCSWKSSFKILFANVV